MDRFIGSADYVNPTFVDPVWGVSDQRIVEKAHESQSIGSKNVQKLQNHSPQRGCARDLH
jgi:hypothetical protein